MERYFNTEGICVPEEHYMVRLDERLHSIKKLFVDRGKYFVISRGRQYGKTTTLRALEKYLEEDYLVISMDFQRISSADFADEQMFAAAFMECVQEQLSAKGDSMGHAGQDVFQESGTLKDEGRISLDKLFGGLGRICRNAKKPVVMIIDEVDSASNNQVFVDFLGFLRQCYLNRRSIPALHSVILAGVYDVKNLKLKIRPDEKHRYNSPWNIAADFNIDMDFSQEQICSMLEEYEADHHTGMAPGEIARSIYEYTSGYPYLVSAVCKLMDERVGTAAGSLDKGTPWTKAGVMEAVKIMMDQQAPLFGSMIRQLDDHPDLKQMLHALLFQGKRVTFNPDNAVIGLASMFGYIVNRQGRVQVANRIFEMRLYNFFLSEEELRSAIYDEGQKNRDQFIHGGRLDMEQVLEKFVMHFTDIYGDNDGRFIEEYGRKLFLLYLKPIINGTGNYYIEAQTRDAKRTDIVVDYLGEQFVVEIKIWHGNEYNERGEKQLAGYLDYFHTEKGYMLSFNFNKKKKAGMKEIRVGDKVLIEAVV